MGLAGFGKEIDQESTENRSSDYVGEQIPQSKQEMIP